ncbi:uncharacterized protein LOC119666892 [Teleopsis dalmanni]|uniref:uncharacterized protein LOC119666892 n=1 Tax=Teleopsis dalmanni TaxID=139649 RepID=UPI0018CF61B7|nr:uncharacterized protein LOC119666892 [Teleopsis dalmanni]XP_037932108.1 uncharacterized protein LOC119666892 [Teleopsis dalmanni]XP_037932116.1 uncharacterized protein LOC119666892 [Teleopsis dalmanni]
MGLTGNASVGIRDLTDLDERIIAVMHPVAVQGMVDVCEPAMHIESDISCFDDLEYLEDGKELPSGSGRSACVNDVGCVPLRANRPAKRRNRNPSLEQTNQKFVELQEKMLKLEERRLELEERKLKQGKEIADERVQATKEHTDAIKLLADALNNFNK